uniref:Uncharacterized protein n=1 Tax=Arundo donax TaxID=35708 RepID=A0A0A8Z4I5_ARUDO
MIHVLLSDLARKRLFFTGVFYCNTT